MATGARHRGVCAGQREGSVVVVKRCPCPICGGVADGTIGRKSRRDVVGVGRPLKGAQVAGDASGVGAGQTVVVVHVALLA